MNMQVLSDQVLLNRYLSGNRSAISQLIERHSRRVKDYIRMMVKDDELAEDLFQETFDYFRAQKQSKLINESEAGYDLFGSLKLADRNVEDRMVAEQIEADVRQLIELLPEEQREVVVMRYYSDMSFKEIAEQTGVSINTALGRMRYALINLRRMIREKNLVLC